MTVEGWGDWESNLCVEMFKIHRSRGLEMEEAQRLAVQDVVYLRHELRCLRFPPDGNVQEPK